MPSQQTDLRNELLKPDREFTITEARRVVNPIYGDNDNPIDTQDRFHNPFFHEICPLLSIAEHVGDEATRIVFTGPASRFDGLIILGDGRERQKVEMTTAIDGRNDALQMELLKKRGHAPGFRKIEATGTKKNRKFGKNESEMINSEGYNQETLLPLLENALLRKKEKAKQSPSYTGAWLGIVFDDWIEPSIEKKPGRFDPICRQALADGTERYDPFSRVFFVGISRQYLFDSRDILQ